MALPLQEALQAAPAHADPQLQHSCQPCQEVRTTGLPSLTPRLLYQPAGELSGLDRHPSLVSPCSGDSTSCRQKDVRVCMRTRRQAGLRSSSQRTRGADDDQVFTCPQGLQTRHDQGSQGGTKEPLFCLFFRLWAQTTEGGAEGSCG